MLCKVIYDFSKGTPKFIRHYMSKEFMRMRPFAVKALNPCFDKWNSEYSGTEPGPDIWSDQAKEYNNYICDKMRVVLDTVNKEHSKAFYIDVDEIGDLICRSKLNKNWYLTLELEMLKD